MASLNTSSISEQVASHLREGIRNGRWKELMPGRDLLASELGVSPWSIQRGLDILESEELLAPQGGRRRRRIVRPEEGFEPQNFKIEILLYEEDDRKSDYMVDLRHRLQEAGHAAGFAAKTLTGLGMDVKRVARLVEATPADAWVVLAGSLEVLEWFSHQPVPAFALFGRQVGVSLASVSPKKAPALLTAVRLLVAQGHRRIVMLAREERRKPEPGFLERVFLDELEAQGILTGSYNLPDWQDDVTGLHHCLDSLFQHTPPTALIIGQSMLFLAARQHLAQRGILAPRDVSMICMDPDPDFMWYAPPISHIRWDPEPLLRRILRWTDNVARGKEDRRKTTNMAEFIEGGTIGPAKVGVAGMGWGHVRGLVRGQANEFYNPDDDSL